MTPAKTEQLRSRLDAALVSFEDAAPETLARLLVAKACNVMLDDSGAMGAIWMIGHASDLLGGHWSPETINTFIETKR